MPKRISESELDAIKQAVEKFPDGALIEDISHALNEAINRRTLQRRLAVLVDRNWIEIEGRGKGTRYKILQPIVIEIGQVHERSTALPISVVPSNNIQIGTAYEKDIALPIGVVGGDPNIPISDERVSIKQAVQSPIQNRVFVHPNLQ